jgi:hypothetical protein
VTPALAMVSVGTMTLSSIFIAEEVTEGQLRNVKLGLDV